PSCTRDTPPPPPRAGCSRSTGTPHPDPPGTPAPVRRAAVLALRRWADPCPHDTCRGPGAPAVHSLVSPARRLLIWLAPAPLLAAPTAVVFLHERAERSAGILDTIVMSPAVVPALLGLDNFPAMLALSGLFWYLLAALFLNSLLGRPARGSRIAFILLLAAAIILTTLGRPLSR